MFLSGIQTLTEAFGPEPRSDDPQVAEAVSLLLDVRNRPGALGFFGREKTADAVSTAVRLLAENGKTLTPEQTLAVVDQLRKLDEIRSTRRRFAVQVLVTLVALVVAVSIVFGFLGATDDLKKVGYGLIGTVIGYWLK
jgi:hypothetical protein